MGGGRESMRVRAELKWGRIAAIYLSDKKGVKRKNFLKNPLPYPSITSPILARISENNSASSTLPSQPPKSPSPFFSSTYTLTIDILRRGVVYFILVDKSPENTPSQTEMPIPFPETAPPPTSVCSWNECPAGHRWPPTIGVASCQGCGSPVVAFMKTQCPYCNEPTVRSMVRSDFVPRGAGLASRCQGQKPLGESVDLELLRTEWVKIDSTYQSFSEREAAEKRCPTL
jgi:hypothetical protein